MPAPRTTTVEIDTRVAGSRHDIAYWLDAGAEQLRGIGLNIQARILSEHAAHIKAATRPAEPTGLGAVVKAGGRCRSRMARPTPDGACWETVDGIHQINLWDELPGPIEIVFEGVTL